MKNFAFGFFAGLTIAYSYNFFILNSNSAEEVTSSPVMELREESYVKQNDKATFHQHTPTKLPRENDNNQKVSANIEVGNRKTSDGPERNRIENILKGLNKEDLKRVESMVSRLKEKSPIEKFEAESIEPEWSLMKQAELEYSFYESSVLRDMGNLDSVICKSQSCQVKVSIPSDLDLSPSHFVDWYDPVATNLMPHQSDPDLKTLIIYIQR